MPIYVFRCESCGHKFDHLQKLSAADPDVCPNCGERDTLHRQVTAPAFRLAGSGWYETDFKSDKEKKHNLADNGGGKPEPAGDKPPDTGNADSGMADTGKGDSGKGGEPGKPAAKPAETGKPAAAAGD